MPRKHDPARERPVSLWVPASEADRRAADEYPPAWEVRAVLERVRKRAAKRRGKPYVPPKPVRGRPSDAHWVTCHDWAELIAKYRDDPRYWNLPKDYDDPKSENFKKYDDLKYWNHQKHHHQIEPLPVWCCFARRAERGARDAIDKALFHRPEGDGPPVIPQGWKKNPRRSLYRLWVELQSAFPRPGRVERSQMMQALADYLGDLREDQQRAPREPRRDR